MMTYKSALAGLPQGRGKSVLIGDSPRGENACPAARAGSASPGRRRLLRGEEARNPPRGLPLLFFQVVMWQNTWTLDWDFGRGVVDLGQV